MANTENPHVGPDDSRLVLTAATLGLGVAAGRIDLTMTHLSAVAHSSGPDCGRGGGVFLGGGRGKGLFGRLTDGSRACDAG